MNSQSNQSIQNSEAYAENVSEDEPIDRLGL